MPRKKPPPTLPTTLAIGSDGRIYINAEGYSAAKIRGRKRFVGFRLTREEERRAWKDIHHIAPNVPICLRWSSRRKRRKPAPEGER